MNMSMNEAVARSRMRTLMAHAVLDGLNFATYTGDEAPKPIVGPTS
jgi:hypothetical protein